MNVIERASTRSLPGKVVRINPATKVKYNPRAYLVPIFGFKLGLLLLVFNAYLIGSS